MRTAVAGPSPYDARVAIPLPTDEEARRILGESYDAAKALNVVKMFAGTGDMCQASLGLVRAVFAADGVDPKLRQAIILRAATALDAPYEWQANVPMSRNNGLSEAEIERIGTLGPVTGLPPDRALVCTATDEMCSAGTLRDETLQRLLDAHGERSSARSS